jgi:hypothetical protein
MEGLASSTPTLNCERELRKLPEPVKRPGTNTYTKIRTSGPLARVEI